MMSALEDRAQTAKGSLALVQPVVQGRILKGGVIQLDTQVSELGDNGYAEVVAELRNAQEGAVVALPNEFPTDRRAESPAKCKDRL